MNNTALKNAGAAVLQSLGLPRLLRLLNRHKVAVLMYHGVVRDDETPLPPWMLPEREFRWQMEYLARHYRVLPLAQVVERLLAGRPLPPYSLVLTFDDGFRNNYTIAYPILRELGLPATIFLVTGYLDSDQALWPDVLFQAIHRTPVEVLDLADLGDGVHSLKTLADRRSSFLAVVEHLKTLPVDEKNRRLEEITRRLKFDLDQFSNREDAPFALLRQQEIRRMAQEGLVSFGVHTDTHEILTRFPLAAAQREIRISKRKLETLLGEPARFFAYPNGTPADFNDALKQELKQQGFTCAFASGGGLINSRFDPFALARIGVGPDLNDAYFQLKLSGSVEALKQVRGWLVRNGR